MHNFYFEHLSWLETGAGHQICIMSTQLHVRFSFPDFEEGH